VEIIIHCALYPHNFVETHGSFTFSQKLAIFPSLDPEESSQQLPFLFFQDQL
jgi:hypothetical protein